MKKADITLVACAFLLVLFLNTYFNLTSGVAINEAGTTVEEKFYLAGPDPYYNMRLVVKTLENGTYPFIGGVYGDLDPLLNYPLGGTGGRPPLFNMITIGAGKILSLFMNETDAIGYAMQFLPALYGAMLVIPVYFIGKHVFNRKVGIIASLFVALIPIHISSGHGSAYSLYDHDSFLLLLTATTLAFLIMSIKEQDTKKSIILAAFSGIAIAAMTMTWVSSQYIYALVGVYGVVQMIVDIFTKRINKNVVRTLLIALFTGYIISFPVLWVKRGFELTPQLFIPLAVAAFSIIYLWLGKKNIPWIISLPTIFGVGGIGLLFLYVVQNTSIKLFAPLKKLSDVIFGPGIYGKKVSLTIAEASKFDLGRTAMSFGPALYLLAWFGFLLFLYRFYKKKYPRESLVIFVWFIVEAWLTSIAGRFLNDLVPLVALLGAFVIWVALIKIDFSSMIKTVKSLGSGWQGIKKGIKARHVAGTFIIVLFVLIPNSWLAFDASVPANMKEKFNTNKLGAFGLGLHTEKYWTDALLWLKEQNKNFSNKPAFISWWDYGFYCVAIAENPTVADNFQEGIPTAANLHTSESEREAVSVFIVRLVEGDMKKNDGKVSDEVKNVFEKYIGNKSADLVKILEDPTNYENTSYGQIIGEEYEGKQFTVREENAVYHDAVKILSSLDDENITMLYKEIQNVTGYNIRYYGVEGYDINIFSVFTFLADKGLYGYETSEDDYYKLWYTAKNQLWIPVQGSGQKFTPDEVKNLSEKMTQDDLREIYGNFIAFTEKKDAFYNSMVYRVYMGDVSKSVFENYSYFQTLFHFYYPQVPQNVYSYYNYFTSLVLGGMKPTSGLRHFAVEYISPSTGNDSLLFRRARLCYGCPAVVISKYYEGAKISGKLESEGEPLVGIKAVVEQKVSIFDEERRISHDSVITDKDGKFTLLAPAGNITLSFYSGDVLIKEITFNGTGVFAPISEEEATRTTFWNPDSWKRNIGTINVERGGIKGIVFWDKDGDGIYNESIDKPMKAKVKIGDKEISTNSNGRYELHNLIPKRYPVSARVNGYDSKRTSVIIKSNEIIWQNISLTPSKVAVTGKVWYDENRNGRIDENETMEDVPISFTIIKALDKNAKNDSVSSDTGGNYTISLYPAKYRIEVNYTTGNVTYYYEDVIDLKIGDKTKVKNIKLARRE